MLGGDYCNTPVPADLLPGDIQQLAAREMDALWRLFQEIGRTWNKPPSASVDTKSHSINISSDWREFIQAKTSTPPSYTGEYSNAVSCVAELIRMYGEADAYSKLLLNVDLPPDPKTPPVTRIAHCKTYVVNEFIRVQVVKEGFKFWQGRNYNGFVGGSRFNRKPRARVVAEGQGA
jgi:hypothetical protein